MKFKKILATTLSIALLFSHTVSAIAIDVPEAPTAPTAPTAPSAPEAPTAPSAPTAPTAPSYGDNSSTNDQNQNNDRNSDQNNHEHRSRDDRHNNDTNSSSGDQNQNSVPAADTQTQSDPASTPATTPTNQETQNQNTGSQDVQGQNDPSITTGDANNTAVLDTTANSNLATTGGGNGPSAGIANTGNGSGSTNSGSANISSGTTTTQDNSANIANDLNQHTNTGNNTASKNMGDTNITTGDANTSGTIINSVNSNLAGVMVSEFDVADDHVGDLVLDFASNCISGCGGGSSSITNSGNGAESTNSGTLNSTNENNTFQTNDATIENSMNLSSDSGHNDANKNTGGDTNITTGDANVSASALTFANTNVAGNVVYGVVNIYGDLKGDIVFPEEMLGCCGVPNTTVANVGNGAGSTNNGTVDITSTDETFQTNTAVIDNVLYVDAQTGDNDVNKNTNGNNSVTTGDANVDVNVVNIANNNVDGGVWWLVLVNEAGNWIGQIMGSPDGSTMAGSEGTQFTMSPTGEIVVTNSGNGADSTNNGTVTQNNSNTTVQTNTAHITNNLNLSANTGENSTSKNTGGDSSVQTGDANIVANIVNFVNNNITGNGKLFVTVVNVFGSWVGDFVGPGQHKQEQAAAPTNNNEPAIGGAQVNGGGSPSNTTTAASSSQNVTDNQQTNESSDDNATNWNPLASVFSGKSSGPGTGTLVLGETTQNNGQQQNGATVNGKKTITINLAWLILLAACAILALAVRKIALKILHRRKAPAFT